MTTEVINESASGRVAELLKLLGNPIRLKIIALLRHQDELRTGVIQQQVGVSMALVSQYLTKMSARGLLTRERRGSEVYFSLADPILSECLSLLLNERRGSSAATKNATKQN